MDGQCQAITKGGMRCRGQARASGFCFSHDPALSQARRTGAATGGRNRSAEARLGRLVPSPLRLAVHKALTAVDEVHDGTLEPRQATAMASLISAAGRVYEVAELEQRLEALEQHVAHGRQGAGDVESVAKGD